MSLRLHRLRRVRGSSLRAGRALNAQERKIAPQLFQFLRDQEQILNPRYSLADGRLRGLKVSERESGQGAVLRANSASAAMTFAIFTRFGPGKRTDRVGVVCNVRAGGAEIEDGLASGAWTLYAWTWDMTSWRIFLWLRHQNDSETKL
jgi:hypothetical protein